MKGRFVRPGVSLPGVDRVAMRRPWLRLVACLTLAAYLLTNIPVGATAGVHALAGLPCGGRACPHTATNTTPITLEANAPGSTAETPKKRCCCKKDSQAPAQTDQVVLDRVDGPCSRPSCPDPTCPCHSCPCPGGCAYCSVSKVPCCSSTHLLSFAFPCPGERVAESAQFYSPAHPGKLMRPPRV